MTKLPSFLILLLMHFLPACSPSNPQAQEPENKPIPTEMSQPATSLLAIDSTLLATDKDVVCGMSVRNAIADTAHHHGKVYGFCNESCKASFVRNPESYLAETNQP